MKSRLFTVYDMKNDPGGRWAETDCGPMRLEHCVFYRRGDGSFELRIQVGWHAGSHYDGGEMVRAIPQAWLSLSWEAFLACFSDSFPACKYIVSAEDLRQAPGLREFLGIGSEKESRKALT